MTEKRFELRSYHFHKLEANIYDNLKKEELHLSIYQIVELLNEISQSDYDLQKLKDEICQKLDEVIE